MSKTNFHGKLWWYNQSDLTNNERRIYCYDPLNWKSSLGNSILLTRVFSLKIDQWKECPSGANEVVRQLRDGFQRQGQNIQQQ